MLVCYHVEYQGDTNWSLRSLRPLQVNSLFPISLTSKIHVSEQSIIQNHYNKSPTPNNLPWLTKAQDSFQSACISAKSTFEQSLIHNFATKKFPKIFHFIKKFSKTQFLPPELHDDSTKAVTNFDKAELFNQYFYSIFTQSNFCLPNMSNLPIYSIHFSVQDVMDVLCNLNPNKACGIDNIPPIVLKSHRSTHSPSVHYQY